MLPFGDPLCRMTGASAKRVFLFEETGNGSKHTKLEE
jgi:hypothetical protein